MQNKTCNTYWVKIFIAGPIEVAKQILRRECMKEGLCVTIEPTTYIYTGCEESGYVVGFINYPRFPKPSKEIFKRAKEIAEILRSETFQYSYTIQDPEFTEWVSIRQ